MQISQIDRNGYNPFCDETLHLRYAPKCFVIYMYAGVTPSYESQSRKSHVRQLSRSCVGRGYLVAVTGSMWLLRGVHGCYGVYVPLFFANNRLARLLRDRFTRRCDHGIILCYTVMCIKQPPYLLNAVPIICTSK